MGTRVNQLLGLDIVFLRLLDLLLHLQDLHPTVIHCVQGGVARGAVTVALGSTSMTNLFCWRSLMVSFMATAQRSTRQPMSTGGNEETARECALGGQDEQGKRAGRREVSRAGQEARVVLLRWHRQDVDA